MSEASPLEERLTNVEQDLADLKRQVAAKSSGNWIHHVAGSFKDEPEFDEILRLGQQVRRSKDPDSPE